MKKKVASPTYHQTLYEGCKSVGRGSKQYVERGSLTTIRSQGEVLVWGRHDKHYRLWHQVVISMSQAETTDSNDRRSGSLQSQSHHPTLSVTTTKQATSPVVCCIGVYESTKCIMGVTSEWFMSPNGAALQHTGWLPFHPNAKCSSAIRCALPKRPRRAIFLYYAYGPILISDQSNSYKHVLILGKKWHRRLPTSRRVV